MSAQIGEVLLTYWRKAISSRLALLAVIVPVIGIFESVLVEKKQIAMALWMGIYGPVFIALHFKQQLIQISQRRNPSDKRVDVNSHSSPLHCENMNARQLRQHGQTPNTSSGPAPRVRKPSIFL